MKRVISILATVALLIATIGHAPVSAQGGNVVLTSPAQVTGSGIAVKVAASGTARWLNVSAGSSNSATVQCGDSNVSATRGTPISAGGALFFPPMPFDSRLSISMGYYSLSTIYCYIGSGDTVQYTWAN